MWDIENTVVVVKNKPGSEVVCCGDIYQVVDEDSGLNGRVYIVATVLNARGHLAYNLVSLNEGSRFTCEYGSPEELISAIRRLYNLEKVASCGKCTITIERN
jgi:hypothetical protein